MTSVRDASRVDLLDVLELWARAGLSLRHTDSVAALETLLEHEPRSLLLADANGEVVGSLIAAWNGWRGSFFRLAVDPAHRRRGIAHALVREGEARLRERGAQRLDAIVTSDDETAMGFWQALGYLIDGNRTRLVRHVSGS